MWKYISLILICGSANAAIYSCVDDSGKKVLRSEPCEQNEKQQPVVIKADPPYYTINSTGKKQGIDSYQAKQTTNSVAQSTARKSTTSNQSKDQKQSNFDLAKEYSLAGGDLRPEIVGTRFKNAFDCLNGQTTAQSTARKSTTSNQSKDQKQSNFDLAKEYSLAGGDLRPEIVGTRFKNACDGLNGKTTPPSEPEPSFKPRNARAEPQPSSITSCDSGGCWDNLGNRYNGGAGGIYFGPTGVCQDIGGRMQCP